MFRSWTLHRRNSFRPALDMINRPNTASYRGKALRPAYASRPKRTKQTKSNNSRDNNIYFDIQRSESTDAFIQPRKPWVMEKRTIGKERSFHSATRRSSRCDIQNTLKQAYNVLHRISPHDQHHRQGEKLQLYYTGLQLLPLESADRVECKTSTIDL
jgi:hypothetical protein